MRTNKSILTEAYIRLAKRVAAWAAVLAMVAPAFLPGAASAATIYATAKSATLSSSAPSATAVSYDIKFTGQSGSLIKSIRFQFCDLASTPIYNTACTIPAGLVRGTTIATQTYNGSAFTNSYAAATNGTSDVLLTNATGNTFTAGQVANVKLTGFTNPSTANVQFFVRIVTCDDTSCVVGAATNHDIGGIALATTQSILVNGSVQENLVFCTGVSGVTCANLTSSGASLTLAPNPMTSALYSQGTSAFIVGTNASSGYSVSYMVDSATNGVCTATTGFCDKTNGRIGTDSTGNVASLGNRGTAEQFGMNLAANTYPGAIGAAGSGAAANYNTADTYSFSSAASPTVIATGAAVSQNNYTVTYNANVTAATKPGQYSVSINYVCTGTF